MRRYKNINYRYKPGKILITSIKKYAPKTQTKNNYLLTIY